MGLLLRVGGGSERFNLQWGSEYMFMDSNTFMGGLGGAQYDTIIDMLNKIWETDGNRVFTR